MSFMTFIDDAADLIGQHDTFVADVGSVVVDLGDQKQHIEARLFDAAKGYAISVWPPVEGVASEDQASGECNVGSSVTVRVEINPKTGLANATSTKWNYVANFIRSVTDALLSADADPGGVKWELEPNFFSLIQFDEGLIAFHLRFKRVEIIP